MSRFAQRIDTAANWTSVNPVLALGEIGFETVATNNKYKIGDGVTAWASLAYFASPTATALASGAAGQLPYQSGSGVTAFSAAGTSGQFLISGGTGAPTWTSTPALGTPSSGNLANCTFPTLNQNTTGTAAALASGAAGQIPYQSGSGATAFSAAGTSGQLLISGGTGSPTWTSTPALGTPSSGTLTNCTFPTLNQNTTGSAGSLLAFATVTTLKEVATISGTGLATTATINTTTQSVYWSNAAATANYAVNLTSTAGLNTSMAVGDSVTVELITNNTGTAYYATSVQVEGTTSGVTTVWQGGTAPSSGNINSKDIYTFQIVKTASATYTVFASQTKFA